MQQRAAHRPDEDEGHSGDEGRGLAHDMGASGCDAGEEMVHGYLRWNEGLSVYSWPRSLGRAAWRGRPCEGSGGRSPRSGNPDRKSVVWGTSVSVRVDLG